MPLRLHSLNVLKVICEENIITRKLQPTKATYSIRKKSLKFQP